MPIFQGTKKKNLEGVSNQEKIKYYKYRNLHDIFSTNGWHFFFFNNHKPDM